MTKKKWMNKKLLDLDLNTSDNKEYKIEAIWDSTVYINKIGRHLLNLSSWIASKSYLEEENT